MKNKNKKLAQSFQIKTIPCYSKHFFSPETLRKKRGKRRILAAIGLKLVNSQDTKL